jgi:hypothetical protein
VVALGIERTAHRQHVLGSVGEGQLEVPLEVQGVVAAATPELEHRVECPVTLLL